MEAQNKAAHHSFMCFCRCFTRLNIRIQRNCDGNICVANCIAVTVVFNRGITTQRHYHRNQCTFRKNKRALMDTQIGYEQLWYAVWTVSYSNQIPSGYAQNLTVLVDNLNEAKILAWNSRWHSLKGLTQSDIITSLSHGTADWSSPVSVANELTAQHSNIWLVFAVAVVAFFINPPPSPAPPV